MDAENAAHCGADLVASQLNARKEVPPTGLHSVAVQLPSTSELTSLTDDNNNNNDRSTTTNNNSHLNQNAYRTTSFARSLLLAPYCGRPLASRYATDHPRGRDFERSALTGSNDRGPDSRDAPATDSDDSSTTPPPNYHEIPGIVPSYQGRTSGPPPSYDDVVNPNASPPSYQSLFGQVREARKTSNGVVDLFKQMFLIFIGTLGCTIIIGILLIIPITMILVGMVYVNDCRVENIPSILVVGGLVWIARNMLNCYNQFKKDSTTGNRPPPRRAPISRHQGAHNATREATVSRRSRHHHQTMLAMTQQQATSSSLPMVTGTSSRSISLSSATSAPAALTRHQEPAQTMSHLVTGTASAASSSQSSPLLTTSRQTSSDFNTQAIRLASSNNHDDLATNSIDAGYSTPDQRPQCSQSQSATVNFYQQQANDSDGSTTGPTTSNEQILAPNDNQVSATSTTITPSTTTIIRDGLARDHHNGNNRINPPSLIGFTSLKCEHILNYFLLVWFAASCIVVYRTYEPDYHNINSDTYCNRTVYLFAFWLMTSAFMLMAAILGCLCCLMASSMMSCNDWR